MSSSLHPDPRAHITYQSDALTCCPCLSSDHDDACNWTNEPLLFHLLYTLYIYFQTKSRKLCKYLLVYFHDAPNGRLTFLGKCLQTREYYTSSIYTPFALSLSVYLAQYAFFAWCHERTYAYRIAGSRIYSVQYSETTRLLGVVYMHMEICTICTTNKDIFS